MAATNAGDLDLDQLQISSGSAQTTIDSANEEDVAGRSLARHDGGCAAWRMLFTAFVFEALLWDSRYTSVIGTTASGISYLAAPIVIPLIKRFSKYRRHMIYIGWPLCLAGLVAGSFAKTLGALIFTQGIMYGFGFTLFYYPILSMVNKYWITRRGMAYGLLCSASGVSGAAMPFGVEWLLHRYGYPTTLRVIAVGLFVLTGPLIPLLRGRLPESEPSTSARTDFAFLKTPLFWIYSISNLLMGMGYFFPSLYLPSYATSNGMTSTNGVVLLATMSISQVVGQLSFGYLSDRNVPINVLITSPTTIACIAVYTSWGLAHTFNVLLVFSLLYGFFGAGYTATWARMGTAISSEPTAAFTAFGLLNFGKGVGNILAGPIGGALLTSSDDVGGYGAKRYEGVILFAGSCMFLSGASVGLCYVDISKAGNSLRSFLRPR
ncbi:hypothetical protein LTR15_004400 [Elasticomyces elasticus]|nr:hypothetical protein LTR15_004400 [Elasticomyces elasticus]